jgi:hypothetical protein
MNKITNEQWQEAHRIIDQCKKEHAMQKSQQIKNFIKECDRTFWKQKTDYHTAYFHVSIDKIESHYATVYLFEIHTNGKREIKTKIFNQNELDSFLDGVSEESINHERDRDRCDCECECSCYDDEVKLPKISIMRITEKTFKKLVQEKILDTYSIGLTFKEKTP